jgi:hypothetical protein
MAGISDLLTESDAKELECLFDSVVRERKKWEEDIGRGFADAQRRALLLMEVDVPEFEF